MPSYEIICNYPQSREDLIAGYEFLKRELDLQENHPRNIEYYLQVYETFPQLMMIAKNEHDIIGGIYSSKNQFDETAIGEIVIGEVCVREDFQQQHIGSKMLAMLEQNAKQYGFTHILLGAASGKEGFYQKNGYLPQLFVQIQNDRCLERLKCLNPSYPVRTAKVEGGWTRFHLETNKIVPQLELTYLALFPKASITYLMVKHIA